MRVSQVQTWRWWWWWTCVVAGAGAGARELDPAACATRFDLQRDKIIRTEESREMGARYISELDVGARQECLRLCCETDACDVFVYEEKGPGSCYLFKCGPPEDFRCKFTAHSNFSSGVLAVSRRLAELQDQETLAHHERDLASLRSATPAPTPPTTSSSTTPAPPPPPPPAPARAPLAPATTAQAGQAGQAGRCSRYQFECRRGGECIAVYNACDGVPQCEDGSDEAPELGCPPPAAAAAPAPAPAERWPHRLAQAQHRYNNEPARAGPPPGSHIFSHKGGLVQETEPPQQPQYPPFEPPAPWPRRLWPQQQNGAWGGYEWGEQEGGRAWPVPGSRPGDGALAPGYNTMPEVPPVLLPYSNQQQTLRDSAKKGPEPPRFASPPPPPPPPPPDRREEEPPPPPAAATASTKPRDKSAVAVSSRAVVPGGGGGSAMERHLALEEHEDGLSEHPPAAVLLLVIGVCMTGCMGAMVCMRGRAARRRLRRGKPLAHDADYLVNGMYL